MYFTRFPLNMTRRETARILSSPYRMHAAIAGSFPDAAHANSGGRVLWRVDHQDSGAALLYIVSPTVPSLVGLDEQIGWPDLEQQWKTRDYDAFLSDIAAKKRYSFRLVANPVVSRPGIKNERGDSKRISHLTPLQAAAWLVGASAYEGSGIEPPDLFVRQSTSRAERNGFVVCRDSTSGVQRLLVSDVRKEVFRKKDRRITLARARFDGVLEVTDPDLVRNALVRGIGHAKGFGCGLLTLVPVES